MIEFPHGRALQNVRSNKNLPPSDVSLMDTAIEAYEKFKQNISKLQNKFKNSSISQDEFIELMVKELNKYKLKVDMNLIYDSEHNFLYRNKGQLKLTSTILEEFMIHLIPTVFQDLLQDLQIGSIRCVSSLHFEGGNLVKTEKNQDFAIAKLVKFEVSSQEQEKQNNTSLEMLIPLVAIECKTYVDKNMFQEAIATSNSMKRLCPNSKYFLLAEYLSMTPSTTVHTNIDRIFIARKAKKLREKFGRDLESHEERVKVRDEFVRLLNSNKLESDIFKMLIDDIRPALECGIETDEIVLERGHF